MPAEPIPIAPQDNQQQAFPSLSSSHPIFGRWSAFSPKSPSQAAGVGVGAGSPPGNPASSLHDDDDIGDLRSHTWAHAAAQRGQRRAASLSMSAGSSLLGSQLGNSSVGSLPAGGPLSDKVALGQGVLRRLSFSNGFGAASGRPGNVPPPVPSPPNPTPIGSLKPNDGLAAHPPPPPADPGVNRAGTIAGSRRRFSESTARRRGVSPMGERLLRDQVHF